jgi:hypothetical protein
MRLVPETSSLARWLAAAALAGVLAGLAAARLRPDVLAAASHCPWQDATGLACPTCGGTAAAIALADGRIRDALAANPLVPLLAVAVAAWAAWAAAAAFIPRLRMRLALGPGETKAARLLAALALLALWARQIIVPGWP